MKVVLGALLSPSAVFHLPSLSLPLVIRFQAVAEEPSIPPYVLHLGIVPIDIDLQGRGRARARAGPRALKVVGDRGRL